MSEPPFRVLQVDLRSGKGELLELEGRSRWAGGSGLAAMLLGRFARLDRPWDDPEQPLIFAIGPLTGLYPLMSKTVCAFVSPRHGQVAESHGGGRSALALRLAGLDALVITGRAARLSCLSLGSRHLALQDVQFLKGQDVQAAGKILRRILPGAGHRSILRIGPAGEARAAIACINVDTYRHFGRLGAGAVMGAKNLKAIAVQGDGSPAIPGGDDYPRLFEEVYRLLTATDMMHKYHNLGTAENVAVLNALQALPFRNLRQTHDPRAAAISGEAFADRTLLRNAACAGCPVGCIHIGFVREKFMEPNQYIYRQVSYDHEPIFAVGAMLAVCDPFAALDLMEEADRAGLDVMSAGVALAWATEASERGLLSARETRVALSFGDARAYAQAMGHLARGENDFYRLLASGVERAAAHYGGEDFACVLGQETAGYATGEVFFVSQALGFRHSHLDSAGYAYDQRHETPQTEAAVRYLLSEERSRCLLTSMAACLFARAVYTEERLAACLEAAGLPEIAARLPEIGRRVQAERWRLRIAGGFAPETVPFPRRFTEVVTAKGPIDPAFLAALKAETARRIRGLAAEAEKAGAAGGTPNGVDGPAAGG
ncbi:MAG: aldehyde ferredoxin oxidoreductase C-terminal domain-containing protein [Desulfobacterales bacterium]